MTWCDENMQQQQDMLTQEFILKIKFDIDQNNNSNDMKRILTELIQKQDGNIILLATITSSSSSSSWWRPSDSWWTAWNWDSSSLTEQQFFVVPCNRDSGVNDGVCTQNTLSHAFFSRAVCQEVLSGSHPSCSAQI